ncbi:hypothetical protein FRB95_007187 [Tulasnella sp. JGI-2019a]|nr:hypothetical protein FRB93_013629 [Tulasnella sp. JGI-2019a]KAG9039760.1 hypothetical protein FRB95_007187 [Tulasnella sp. JGI-2019a]
MPTQAPSTTAQPQQGPSSTGQYERRQEPARAVKSNNGRRNREITGPNVMTPSAGMRVWGSNSASAEEGSPLEEVEAPKEKPGKRKLDETEPEQPKSKRARKKSEKKALTEDQLASSSPTEAILKPDPVKAVETSTPTITVATEPTAMDVDDSGPPPSEIAGGLPVALDGTSPERKSNKERKAEFKAKLAARSEKEKKSDKQARKEKRQADKKARRRQKQAEKESNMTPAEKKAAKKKRKEERAQREIEKKEKEERRIARRLRHFEKKQRKAKETQEVEAATAATESKIA